MENLGTANFFGMAARVFIHPFRTVSDMREMVVRQSKRANFKLAFLSYLFGNTAMIVAGLVMDTSGTWDGAGFVLFHVVFQLVAGLIANMTLTALFYFFIVFLSREEAPSPDIDKLFCLFFLPDVLLSGLLPLSLLLRAIGPASGVLFGLASLVAMVLTIAMKIRAISAIASIGKGKSSAVFFMPLLLFLATAVLGVVYAVTFVTRMFL